jgi:hypothetical protein
LQLGCLQDSRPQLSDLTVSNLTLSESMPDYLTVYSSDCDDDDDDDTVGNFKCMESYDMLSDASHSSRSDASSNSSRLFGLDFLGDEK